MTEIEKQLIRENEELKILLKKSVDTIKSFSNTFAVDSDGIGIKSDSAEMKDQPEELHHRESMLEEAQRLANLGSWEYDIKNQKVTWSKNLFRIFGQDPANYKPTLESLFSQIHPDDVESVKDVIHQTISKFNSYDYEYRILVGNGKIRDIHSKGKTILDHQGNPEFLMGISLDITERKAVEKQITQQAYLINKVNDAVIASDGNFILTFWNEGAEKIYGWKEKEVLGKSGPDLLQTDFLNVSREEAIRIVAETGSFKAEVRQIHKDGHELFIESSFKIIKDENGNILNYISVNRDLTERRRLEEVIREGSKGNAILERIIEFSSQPLGVGLLNGKIGLVNKAFETLTGYTKEELIEIDWINTLTPSEYREMEINILEELKRDGKPVRYEKEYICKDGTRVPIELLVHIMKDLEGNPEFFFAFITDISERKKNEQNLYQLIRTLRAMQKSSEHLLHAKDEQKILTDVCKVIVEDCGHQMVWIGYKQDNPEKSVDPVAYSGFEEHYIESLKITWEDSPRGNGPTGKAIRTGKMAICRNMQTDPCFEPWREQAIKRGYASSIVLPLSMDDTVFGAISIYSRLPDPFSAEEQQLLLKLAEDLSYGITAIRLNLALAHAKEDLEVKVEERTALLQKTFHDLDSERKRFQDVLNMIPAYVVLITPDYRILFSNKIFVETFGKSKCDQCYEYHLGRSEPCGECPIREILDFNQSCQREWTAPGGKIYQVSDFPFTDSDGSRLILEMGIDITEKKNIENYVLSKILETEEKDRRRFASDLHDDLGPTLSAIKLQIGLLAVEESPDGRNEIVNICDQLLAEGIEKMRTLANYIMPSLIESYGFETAVKSFIHKIEKTCQLSFNFHSNLENYRFDAETERHLYRIVTELVNNTITHSGATDVFLDLFLSDEELNIVYSDNGKGYNPDKNPLQTTGIGLLNIINRVKLVHGTVEFINKVGKTVVEISKPLTNKIS